MAHRYDVSLKTLFLQDGDGIIRRRLFGGSDGPNPSNGLLLQMEFQAASEDHSRLCEGVGEVAIVGWHD